MGTVGPIMEAGGDGPPSHGIHLSRPFPHLLSSTDELGHTDMHLAATKGDAKAVRELIEREMPVDTTSERGFSAAHHAARAGHVEVLHVLHERVPKLLSNPSNEGITVVHLAAKGCSSFCAKGCHIPPGRRTNRVTRPPITRL